MPVLDNPKWELFAQAMAKGNSARESYTLAGYSENDGNAIRLKGNEKVRARIDELLNRRSSRSEMTLDKLTEMFKEDRALARENKHSAAAISATAHLAKMHGHMIERSETGPAGAFADMDDDELNQFIADEKAALGVGDQSSELTTSEEATIPAGRLN